MGYDPNANEDAIVAEPISPDTLDQREEIFIPGVLNQTI